MGLREVAGSIVRQGIPADARRAESSDAKCPNHSHGVQLRATI
jgi:hypothetical protein